MISTIRAAVCGLVFVACVCALALAAAPAAAQENATEADTPDQQITDQLGDLVIHSYNYESGTFTITATWTGTTPETLTINEMIELDSGGSADISFQQQRLLPGERTEITMAAEERSGGTAAVMLTTPSSIDNGEALVLQDGSPTEWPAIELPSAILASGLSAAGAAVLVFVGVVRRKHAEERGIDRIA